MQFSEQQVIDFGVALNEATLLALEVAAEERTATITFAVLSLPAGDEPPPSETIVELTLEPVGRIAASLRHRNWDNDGSRVEQFELGRLADVVASFEQQTIYDWRFLDVPDANAYGWWEDQRSLDWRSEPNGTSHTLDVFQEAAVGTRRDLNLRFWFDKLRIRDSDRREIAFDDFTSAGVRWWDGLHGRDPRTRGHGIVPSAPATPDE